MRIQSLSNSRSDVCSGKRDERRSIFTEDSLFVHPVPLPLPLVSRTTQTHMYLETVRHTKRHPRAHMCPLKKRVSTMHPGSLCRSLLLSLFLLLLFFREKSLSFQLQTPRSTERERERERESHGRKEMHQNARGGQRTTSATKGLLHLVSGNRMRDAAILCYPSLSVSLSLCPSLPFYPTE